MPEYNVELRLMWVVSVEAKDEDEAANRAVIIFQDGEGPDPRVHEPEIIDVEKILVPRTLTEIVDAIAYEAMESGDQTILDLIEEMIDAGYVSAS